MPQTFISKIWFGKSIDACLMRVALTPLSWIYELGWLSYKAIYSLRLKKAAHPHRPIVCVGNLTVGGSGKTPLTMHLADLIALTGRKVVLSCSGYGSPHQESAELAPDGPLKPCEWGDEPAMIRWLKPDVPLIVGRDRVRAAEICSDEHPKAVLLLDDGFQHLRLKKDLTIVIDEPNPPNMRCLPAGPYREPNTASMKAHLTVPLDWPLVVQPNGFTDPDGKNYDSLGEIKVGLLSAIGSPDRFEMSMRQLGLKVQRTLFLQDHDPLTAGNLFEDFPIELPILVTPKDWIKIRERKDLGTRRFFIAMRTVEFAQSEKIAKWIDQNLNEIDA